MFQMLRIVAFSFFFLYADFSFSQDRHKVICVGFYNFENYFDTLNDPHTNDDDFTPSGSMGNTPEVFLKKTENLARVVSEMGQEYTPDGVALLGVAEIENKEVLLHFAKHPLVQSRNYTPVHYDSRDARGIDVALLYNPKYYKPIFSAAIPVPLEEENGKPYYTRDILWSAGLLDGDTVHIFVNHWSSRRGGEKKSSPKREKAAAALKWVVDSLNGVNPDTRVIIMGDFNDDPTDKSIRKGLNVSYEKEATQKSQLYNPFEYYFKKGFGTLAYRDIWNLFDQIMVSQAFLQTDSLHTGYRFFKAKVFNPPYLLEQEGRWQGYPKRSFSGGKFNNGYSDHFPVVLFLTKPVSVSNK